MVSTAPSDALPLPNELMVEILKNLATPFLMRCRSVNRVIRTLIDETPELQYKFALRRAGLLDIPTPHRDVHRAFMELRKREEAWNKFKPIREYDTYPPGCEGLGRNIVADYSRVPASLAKFQQMTPEPLWGLPEKWELSFDFPMHRLGIYPEIDLLVISEPNIVKLHLVTLSTGKPHPLAENPVLLIPDRFSWMGPLFTLSGDYLCAISALESCDDDTAVWVWNWKTGKLHINSYHEYRDNKPTTGAMSAEFLNDHLLLVPVLEGYDKETTEGAFYVYDCNNVVEGRVGYQDMPRIAKFKFPPLAKKANYSQNYAVASELGAHRAFPHQAFVPDPALRLIAFQIEVTGGDAEPVLMGEIPAAAPVAAAPATEELPDYASDSDEEEDDDDDDDGWEFDRFGRLLLFAHAGTFLRFCDPSAPGAEIAWADWAPHARFMRKPADNWLYKGPSDWRICTPEDRPGAPGTVMLYDFAPPPVLRAAAAAGDTGPWEYVLEPTVVVHAALFDGEIRSGLPFRKVNTGLVDAFDREGGGERHRYELTDDCILSQVISQERKPWKVQMWA